MKELSNREVFGVSFILSLLSLSLFGLYEENLILWVHVANFASIATYIGLFLVPLGCLGIGYLATRLLILRWKEFSLVPKIFTTIVTLVCGTETLIVILQLVIVLINLIFHPKGHKITIGPITIVV